MTCKKKRFWLHFNPKFPVEKFYLSTSKIEMVSWKRAEEFWSTKLFFNDLLPKRMKSNYWSLNIRERLEVVGWGWWSFGLVSSEVKIKRNFSQKTDASSRTFQRKKNLGLQGLTIDGATFQVRPWIVKKQTWYFHWEFLWKNDGFRILFFSFFFSIIKIPIFKFFRFLKIFFICYQTHSRLKK